VITDQKISDCESLSSFLCSVSFSVDVATIERTDDYFRFMYDSQGRIIAHKITPDEAKVLKNLRWLHLRCAQIYKKFPCR